MNAITQLVESTPRLQRKAFSPLLAVLASSAIFYSVLLVNLIPTDSRADDLEEVVVEEGPDPEVMAAQARELSREWTYVSGAAGRERIADAIEDATEGLIIGREIAISALREWMAQIGASGSVAVHMLGKVKTTVQMVAIPFLLYDGVVLGLIDTRLWGTGLLWLAAVLTVWSMVYYLRRALPEIRAKGR